MNILLVEDEVSLAMIVKDALEEEGYEVAIARDGLEGLEQYFREHPALIIADVMMPEVDGFEMVRRIRRMDKEVPVLFLSARSSVGYPGGSLGRILFCCNQVYLLLFLPPQDVSLILSN